MKKLLITTLLMLIGDLAFSQNYEALISKADNFYNQKDYPQSLDYYQQAFAIVTKQNPSHYYNAACSAALADSTKFGLDFLEKAVEYGWTNLYHLQSDSDLNSLHEEARWKAIIQNLEAKLAIIEANYDKPLQKELLAIHQEDQAIRNEYINAMETLGNSHPSLDSLGKLMMHSDSANLVKIKKILDTKGWVGKDKVGNQANQALFLVIQHADIATQQQYLPMMREAVKLGNANASSLALLEDRIALREGRRQTYGSQIGSHPDTGESYVQPLDDPDNVDTRRAAVGLGKLADYVSRWGIVWDVEAYKKALPNIEAAEKAKRNN